MKSNYVKSLLDLICNDLFITTDKYLKFAREEAHLYVKRDLLFRPGRWRGAIEIPPHYRISERSRIVITGHSDLLTDQEDLRRFRRLNRSKILLGTNMLSIENISTSLPLGITNDCDDSPIHRVLGSTKHFSIAHEISEFKDVYDSSMYLNFTASNNEGQRSFLLKLLSERPKTLVQSPELNDKGRISYLSNLKAHCLVPCPEGNGIDTHRLWETLYMGGTPIVLKNPVINDLVNHLPVILVNDWREILDEEFLHSEWLRIHSTEMNPDKLSIDFWLKLIREKSSNNPRKGLWRDENR
jgi:hypothetical protein